MPPLSVDVLLPVFGEAPYLNQTLDSIIPEMKDLNSVLIIEDRPTEKTKIAIQNFRNNFPEKVKVIVSKMPGISNALNYGLTCSDAELIARIDSDDLMISGRIAKQRNELLVKNVSVLGGQALFIDKDGKKRRPFKTNNPTSTIGIYSQIYFRNPIAHPTVMFRRSLALAVGGYRSEYEGLEDLDLWVRMKLRGKVRNSKDVYICYRISEEQASRRIRDVTSRHSALLNLLPTRLVRRKTQFLAKVQEIEDQNLNTTTKNLLHFGICCLQLFIISPVLSVIYFSYRTSSHFKCKWYERKMKG
jgi:glycosyltransferase involved in cell wall biosynthesis